MPSRLSCFPDALALGESSNTTPCVHRSIFRYELELRPTGQVEQYSTSATYELQKQDEAWVHKLELVAQAEGKYPEKGLPHLYPQSRLQNSQGGHL